MSQALENYLLREIAELEKQIEAATVERNGLKRRLLMLRQSKGSSSAATNPRSVEKVVAESLIVETLRELGGSGQTRKLYDATKTKLPMMKYGTFRTYLHRMSLEGHVHQKTRGRWRLGPKH